MRTGSIASAALIFAAMTALSGCGPSCTYARRIWDSQCRRVGRTITTAKAAPTDCWTEQNVRVRAGGCSSGSASLCSPASNGALVYAVLLPDDTPARNCFDVWSGDPAGIIPTIQNGLPYDGFYVPSSSTLNCSSSGCAPAALDSCFSTFDSDGNAIAAKIPAGPHKLCYFIDTYQTMSLGNPVVMNSDSTNGYNGIVSYFSGAYDGNGDLISAQAPFVTASYVGSPGASGYCAAPFGSPGCLGTYPTTADLLAALSGATPANPGPPPVPGTGALRSVVTGSHTVLDFNTWSDFKR